MAKALRAVGRVAGVVAAIAMVIPGGQPIAAAASLVAVTANVGAQLAQKKPPSRGSVSETLIGANLPMPCILGRTYSGGNRVHDVGYGGTVSKVKNPYRALVDVYSIGPVNAIEALQADFATVGFSGGNAVGYYHNFLYQSSQLGACPEGSALSGAFGAIPQWGSSYKLSGLAAVLWSLKFDKDGKVFASGVPQLGAIIQGALTYDARLDSTYPGGSGAHRPLDESTYGYSQNPGVHGATYALGRYQNDKKVFGCGFPVDGIDWPAWVEFANVCDANGWTVGGTIYEPGSRWDNLKRICECGAAEPVIVGGKLSVKFSAPKVALDTISADDLAEGEYTVAAMKSRRDRINGIVYRYRSEAHRWEYVQGDLVSDAGYATEDGEERNEEQQFDLIQDKDQAAQVAAYKLVNGREMEPIVLHLKPRFIEYRPGEALMGGADLDELGLDGQLMVITGRVIDPATGIVTLTLMSETTAKHDFALGRTGTAPPTPSLLTGEELDDVFADNSNRQVSIEVTPTLTFAANYEGAVTAGLPSTTSPKVTQGGVPIKTDDATHYAIAADGVAASVDDLDGSPTKGDLTITALTANSGYIDLTVTVGTVAFPAKRIVIAKDVGLASSLGGPGSKIATDNSFNAIDSTSFAPISDTATVTLAGGESLYGTAPLNYELESGPGTRTGTAKWEYSVSGSGIWNDMDPGNDITGSAASTSFGGTVGYGEFHQSKSGLAAGDYEVRLSAKLSGSGLFVNFTGTATVEAKV